MANSEKRSANTSGQAVQSTTPSISAFEAIRHVDEHGQEYWWARELMNALTYSHWQDFHHIIQEAIAVYHQSGGDPSTIFRETPKDSPNAKRKYTILDYRLTRHACYLIVLSASGNKEVIALAKTYFAVTTRLHEIAREEEDRLRLERTPLLYDIDTSLGAQAYVSGVNTDTLFTRFWNAGYRGLYRETASQIRARKGIKRHQQIGDYSSSSELAYLIFKSNLAHDMLIARNVHDAEAAIKVHFAAGNIARSAAAAANVPFPESLPTPKKSYRQLLEEQIERERLAAEDRYGLWGQLDTSAIEQAQQAREMALRTFSSETAIPQPQPDETFDLPASASSEPDDEVAFGIMITIDRTGTDTEYRFSSVDHLHAVEGSAYSVLRLDAPVPTILHLFWIPDMPDGEEHEEALIALDTYLTQIIAHDERLSAAYEAASPLRYRQL